MHFDLIQPCPKCPFRTDCLPGWLGEERAAGIATAITELQQTFACHETVEWDDDEETCTPVTVNDRNQQHCAGALILLEVLGRPNQLMRWMERLGAYDRRKLKMNAPVFQSVEEFIEHHS